MKNWKILLTWVFFVVFFVVVYNKMVNTSPVGSFHFVDCQYEYGVIRSEVWMEDGADIAEEGRKYCESQKVVEVQDGL